VIEESPAIQLPKTKLLVDAIIRIRRKSDFFRVQGVITSIDRSYIAVSGISRFAHVTDVVTIMAGPATVRGEVLKVNETHILASVSGQLELLQIGQTVELLGTQTIEPAFGWIGRVLDADCRPMDGCGNLPSGDVSIPIRGEIPSPTERKLIDKPVKTGVGLIDVFTPLCLGQRIGIFAGSGVGKTTLLSQLTDTPKLDLTVACLVGERSREVKEYLAHRRSTSKNTIVIVSASSDPAHLRRKAALVATTVAEYFRGAGLSVCLLVESLTRFAHAERDIAIGLGELPVARGYPPRVLSSISDLLERAGPGKEGEGDITGIYTVLVDGDDHNDPVADHVRGVLDGHIVLDRRIAESGRYPAIDIKNQYRV
jgi:flagellum-specific ATP synthase